MYAPHQRWDRRQIDIAPLDKPLECYLILALPIHIELKLVNINSV